jgi:hypothetical protein
MDVVAEGDTHAPVHQPVRRHSLVHEAMVVERNYGRDVRLVFPFFGNPFMLTLPNKGYCLQASRQIQMMWIFAR